ncbi:gamma tubulin complex subunit Gfh1 [Schizosaccharomyces octosporus yFS286]|uniref:Gamma tubulin complex subunit Gfh1 n=1 Tax=Schizosaccharomyces octosporus (strain yFS286) TaxID=483514 RepID=S9PPN5_SCHOY|nr:gamma tubulin complex subunit Gfh1 [Schizosaccharomyces octosporus yFS286]EPX71181.1 gamma tubulin complex subunit Gfh1 [Schizosaccharomyces octosporus yFS286]
MLHELLLFLAGYDSSLFLVDNEIITLHPSLQTLHPGERHLLQEIGYLAVERRKTARLFDTSISPLDNRNNVFHRSLYMFVEDIIRKFDENLVDLEQKILTRDSSFVGSEKFVSLTQVEAHLNPWKYTFPDLLMITTTALQYRTAYSIFHSLTLLYIRSSRLDFKQLILEVEIRLQKVWLNHFLEYLVTDFRDDYGYLSVSPDVYEGSGHVLVPFMDLASAKDALFTRICMLKAKSMLIDVYAKLIKEFYGETKSLEFPISQSSVKQTVGRLYALASRDIVFKMASARRLVDLTMMLEMVMLHEDTNVLTTILKRLIEFDVNPSQQIIENPEKYFSMVLRNTVSDLDLDSMYGDCISSLHLAKSLEPLSPNISFKGIPIYLAISLQWPYNMFIDSTIQRDYSRLWSFLGALQVNIIDIKSFSYERKSSVYGNGRYPWKSLWLTLWFLSCLQYYFYDGIIRPSYKVLREKLIELGESGNFEMQVYASLHLDAFNYISKMIFIRDKQFLTILTSIYNEVSNVHYEEVSDENCSLVVLLGQCIQHIRGKENDPSLDSSPISALLLQLGV